MSNPVGAAVATGAAANAAIFNTELDKLGNRIGAAASSSGSIATSIDTDGTLKAGAVDGTVVFGTEVIPSANLATDPYNQRYAPAITYTTLDGRIRWYSITSATRVADASAPGGYVTRIPTTEAGGRRLYLDEMGLVVGDVVSFSIYAKVPTGRTVLAYMQWRTASAAVGSAVASSTQVGDDALHHLTIENQTVPATAVMCYLWVAQSAGTGNVDVHEWICVRGTVARVSARGTQLPAISRKREPTNLAFDPQNELMAVNESIDDRQRWYNTTAFSLVAAAAGTGLGTPTVRFTTTTGGGRRFWLDEMGLKAGDIISVGFMATVTAAKTFLVAVSKIDSGGSVLSSSTNSATGVGTAQIYVCENVTIDANTESIYVYPSTIAASTTLDVYCWYVVKGSTLGENTPTRGGVDGRLALSTAGLFPASMLAYGKGYLRDWFAQIAKIRSADGTSQAVIGMIGDSWAHLDARVVAPVRAWMHAEYGDGGAGWISANDDAYLLTESSVVSRSVTGTWTYGSASSTPRGYGPDLYDASTTDTVTPAKITWTTTTSANEFDIHYKKQTNGLGLEYQVDGGAWSAAVDTNASEAHGYINITGLSDATHIVAVRAAAAVTGSGAGGLTVLGIDCKRVGVNAARVHKLGANGTMATHWNSHPSSTILLAALAQMGVNTVSITLATNEKANDVKPSVFASGLDTLIATLRTGTAFDVMLLMPGDVDNAGAYLALYEPQQFMSALRAVAVRNGCAALNSMALLGSYDTANARGLYFDNYHVNATGGRVIASGLIDELLSDRPTSLVEDLAAHIAATGGSVHGLGTISTQAASAVNITGGSITGITELDVSSDVFRLRTAKTPASASATGNAGEICWDASYVYICTATNTWRRVAHATW